MRVSLQQGRSYRAALRLSGLDAFASNAMLAEALRSVGFDGVVIYSDASELPSGWPDSLRGDKLRFAEGTWARMSSDVELPAQVVRYEVVPLASPSGAGSGGPGTQGRKPGAAPRPDVTVAINPDGSTVTTNADGSKTTTLPEQVIYGDDKRGASQVEQGQIQSGVLGATLGGGFGLLIGRDTGVALAGMLLGAVVGFYVAHAREVTTGGA